MLSSQCLQFSLEGYLPFTVWLFFVEAEIDVVGSNGCGRQIRKSCG